MAPATNTLIVEGTFEELVEELATYLDTTGTAHGKQTNIHGEVQPLLQEGKKEDALKKLVGASSILSTAPERG